MFKGRRLQSGVLLFIINPRNLVRPASLLDCLTNLPGKLFPKKKFHLIFIL